MIFLEVDTGSSWRDVARILKELAGVAHRVHSRRDADSPRQFLAPLFLNQWTTKGKGTKAKAAAPKKGNGKVSQLDAAVQVLKANGEAMNCKAMVDAMLEKGCGKPEARPLPRLSTARFLVRSRPRAARRGSKRRIGVSSR